MLVAYLDEFGHVGPYIGPDHGKFNEHPVFGYGGYVIPAVAIRKFGGFFEYIKENLLGPEIEKANEHPRRWEKKGAALLTTKNYDRYGDELVPALQRLGKRLSDAGGEMFFFGQEKPHGPVSHTQETTQDREDHCLRQTIKRIATIAKSRNEEILVIMDSTESDNRVRAVSTLGSMMFSKTAGPDLKRVVEIPIQADSRLYGTIQFADWLCALYGRLTHYHFVKGSQFSWSVDLANTMSDKCRFSNNSVVWPNEEDNYKADASSLLKADPYWEKRMRVKQKKEDQRAANSKMLNRVKDACSEEFKTRHYIDNY